MNEVSLDQRLSRISTLWTALQQAHASQPEARADAQRALMARYCGAVYRYLLGALRDEDTALELFQEFALRFLRGDFRRADPERGRFRDYVRTALINLVNDYRRARRATPGPLPASFPAPASETRAADDEAEFLNGWREELLNRAWEALKTANATYHAVLLAHVEEPDLPSAEQAKALSARLGKPFTAGSIRVTLHRARERFAELLLEEVAHSLDQPTDAELREELRELKLLSLCAAAGKQRGA